MSQLLEELYGVGGTVKDVNAIKAIANQAAANATKNKKLSILNDKNPYASKIRHFANNIMDWTAAIVGTIAFAMTALVVLFGLSVEFRVLTESLAFLGQETGFAWVLLMIQFVANLFYFSVMQVNTEIIVTRSFSLKTIWLYVKAFVISDESTESTQLEVYARNVVTGVNVAIVATSLAGRLHDIIMSLGGDMPWYQSFQYILEHANLLQMTTIVVALVVLLAVMRANKFFLYTIYTRFANVVGPISVEGDGLVNFLEEDFYQTAYDKAYESSLLEKITYLKSKNKKLLDQPIPNQ